MMRRTSLLWKVAAVWLCATLAAEASTRDRCPGHKGALTITVAAFDTAQLPGQRADFVCDGVGDQVEIQAAIDLLPVAGGTVRLLAGNYSVQENSTSQYCIVIDRSNIRFEFEAGAVVKLADNVYTSGETGHVFQVGSGFLQSPPPLRTNITIWGPGTIDGNRDNNAGTSATGANMGINLRGQLNDFAIGGGLTITQTRGVAFNFSGLPVGGEPLSPYLVKRVRIANLRIITCGEGMLANYVDDVRIDGLLIDDMLDQDGWEPIGVHNLVMSNSVIKNTPGSAMDIFSGTGSATYGNINHVYTNCVFGPSDKLTRDVVAIGVFTSQGTTPTENIVLEDCTILMGNALRGVSIGDTGLGYTNIQSRHITLSSLIIDGANSRDDSDGIYIGDFAEDVNINNCVAYKMGGHGLHINGTSASNQPTRVRVEGGRFYNNDQSGGVSGSGITLGHFADVIRIVGVECYDSQGTPTQDYGIDLSGGPADVIVQGCTFWGNVIDAIRGGAGCSVSDGTVNVLALIDLLLCFGQPAVPGCESADVNQDGTVNVLDLIGLLLADAVCP